MLKFSSVIRTQPLSLPLVSSGLSSKLNCTTNIPNAGDQGPGCEIAGPWLGVVNGADAVALGRAARVSNLVANLTPAQRFLPQE